MPALWTQIKKLAGFTGVGLALLAVFGLVALAALRPLDGYAWVTVPPLAPDYRLDAGLTIQPVSDRVVSDGKYVTAAGVSSGIDMALTLAGRLAGDEAAQAIQLMIEYDPQPPYDAGSADRAPAEIVSRLRARSRFLLSGRRSG